MMQRYVPQPTKHLRRFFDDVDPELPVGSLWSSSALDRLEPLRPTHLSAWSPLSTVGDNLAIDMVEKADELVIRASLPGLRPDEVSVEEKDGWLSIRAHSQWQNDRSQGGSQVRERGLGSWQRTLRLPVEVQGERAEATLQNGVLTVRLPKLEEGRPLFDRIKVKRPRFKLPGIGRDRQKVKVVHH